jgi:hypothetical protein
MTQADIDKLLEGMDACIAEWEDEEPRSDWWQYQRQYAQAFELITMLLDGQP